MTILTASAELGTAQFQLVFHFRQINFFSCLRDGISRGIICYFFLLFFYIKVVRVSETQHNISEIDEVSLTMALCVLDPFPLFSLNKTQTSPPSAREAATIALQQNKTNLLWKNIDTL